MARGMEWQPEHDSLIKTCVGHRLSGTQIVRQLYEKFGLVTSRSAVIAHARRLGLSLKGHDANKINWSLFDARVRALATDGKSLMDIARDLGLSQRAVTKYVDQIGIKVATRYVEKGKDKKPRVRASRDRKFNPQRRGTPRPRPDPEPVVDPVSPYNLSLMDLQDDQCHYPTGEGYCGHPVYVGSYCGWHDSYLHGRPGQIT